MRRAATYFVTCAVLAVAGACTPTVEREGAVKAEAPGERFVAGVRRTVLPNGLTVLIREQRGSGIVALNTWVKAGYFHEPDDVAGMAHLFEHMFFKGSRGFPQPEAIDEAISGAGGETNAGTIYDSTNYHVVIPSENFARGIEIQADAIAHPLFDAAELKKEAEVVIEESNRKLDNPPAVAFERMLAVAFTQHRIKRWRIGSNEVLRNIRRDNLVAFFETLYRPENIIVSIAGDVAHDEALAVVQRTFGTIPRGKLDKRGGPREPAQTEFRFGASQADLKESYSVFGWQTIGASHADEVVLDVLAHVLGSGRSSRLYRAAVNPSAASTVNASHFTFEDVGVFSVRATLPEGNRAEVEQRIAAEIERMRRFGPTAYELLQAKNASEAEFLGEMETANGQAQNLSYYESRGSYRDIAGRLARLEATTADEVRDAARRYLTLDKLTLYHYQPKGAQPVAAAAALERLRRAQESVPAAPEPATPPDLRTSVRLASADTAPTSYTLSNGATLVVQQRRDTPMVAAGIFFRGGRSQESAANAGITRLMQNAMRRGTATRSGEAIDREIEFLGTQLGTRTWEDGFGFVFQTVSRFHEPALRIVADVLANPTFPEDQLTRERALQLAALKRSLDSSSERPMQLLRAALFPGHPYGLPEHGTEATVAAASRAALQDWWKSAVAADRAMIVVVGNAEADDVRRVMEEQLGKLPRAAVALAPTPVPRLPTAVTEATEQRERAQTAMAIGLPIVSPAHPDWPAFEMIETVASGLSGTFFVQLRSRQSLAYVVAGLARPYARHGVFIGYLAGDAGKEAAARAGLLGEIRKLQGEGVAPANLERAKRYYAGSTRIRLQSAAARMGEYGRNYVLQVPLDNTDRILRAVPGLTVADLQRVAKQHLAGENYVYAAVRGKPPAR